MDNRESHNEDTKADILIVTLPLMNGNYGGILQAYALQKYIKSLGGNSVTQMLPLRRRKINVLNSIAKRLLKKLNGQKVKVFIPDVNKIILSEMIGFISNNIKTVNVSLSLDGSVKRFEHYKLFIVGSDQVWRSRYGDVRKYLFGFLKSDNAKRISYAASFGVDTTDEYGPDLVSQTKDLAARFSDISVREDSAINIVYENWGRKATQHVDPTLLLNAEDYIKMAVGNDSHKDKVFSYVLDKTDDKQAVLAAVLDSLNNDCFEIMPTPFTGDDVIFEFPEQYQYPSPKKWLGAFKDASFVVTDSFHGCVFSIIFNKPFIAIGNNERGLARFASLLKLFGLEDRLVLSVDQLDGRLINRSIDWVDVNQKIEKQRRRSERYLSKYIGGLN